MKYLLFMGDFGDHLGGWEHYEEAAETVDFLKAIAKQSTLDWAQIVDRLQNKIILFGDRRLNIEKTFEEGVNTWEWYWGETPGRLWATKLRKTNENIR